MLSGGAGAADGGLAGEGHGAAGAGAGEGSLRVGGFRMMCDGGDSASLVSSSSSGSGCSRRFSNASRMTVALCIMWGSGSKGSEGGRGGGTGVGGPEVDGGAAAADGGLEDGAGAPDKAGAPSSGGCAPAGHMGCAAPSEGTCFGSPKKYWRVPSSTLLKLTSILT